MADLDIAAANINSAISSGRPYVLRGLNIVDGAGSPTYGPADVVVDAGRIREIHVVGGLLGRPQRPTPPAVDADIDLRGCHALPGFIDSHAHIWSFDGLPPREYAYKLWLAHGVTAIREVACAQLGLAATVDEATWAREPRAAAPRIIPYSMFGIGRDSQVTSGDEARLWIDEAARLGAKGIKFFGQRPEIMKAGLCHAKELGLGTACHHALVHSHQLNALQSARWGLSSIEHGYGVPESMLRKPRPTSLPSNFNYQDQRARFVEAGRMWGRAVDPGSQRWAETAQALVDTGVFWVPTLSIYSALRDSVRAVNATWNDMYANHRVWSTWRSHSEWVLDWTTEEECIWSRSYELWMAFINEFYVAGGKVCAGTDAGELFKLFGFSYIEELELLQHSGLSPLDVIRSACLNPAELLGMQADLGSIEEGKFADLNIVEGNPLANLKLLYGHAAVRGQPSLPTPRLVLKEGVAHLPSKLLSEVRHAMTDGQPSRERAAI